MTRAAREMGGVDVLAGLAYGSFGELSAEDFDRSHEITFTGVVNTVLLRAVPGRRSLWTAARLAAATPLDIADGLPGLGGIVRRLR